MERINSLGWPDSLRGEVLELGRMASRYKIKEAEPIAKNILSTLRG